MEGYTKRSPCWDFPGGASGEKSNSAGDLGLVPGLGRSPGERNEVT